MRRNKQNKDNPKIAGYFVQKDKIEKVNEYEDKHKSVLSNITNMLPSNEDHLLKCPEASKSNQNEIAATPEIDKQNTRFKRKRREENCSNEEPDVTSPIYKKSKEGKILRSESPVKKPIFISPNLKSVSPVQNSKFVSPVKSPKIETSVNLEPWDEDDDDEALLACLGDSPFASPVKHKAENADPVRNVLSSKYGRHKVANVVQEKSSLLLYLTEDIEDMGVSNVVKILTVKGSWTSCIVNVNDVVNVDVEWNDDNTAEVDDNHGLIIVHPDTLVSGTAVVSALFCMRKAFLSEKFKSLEGGNRVMLIGTAVHELLQESVRQKCYTRQAITAIIDTIMTTPRMISDILSLGLYEADIRKEVLEFVGHIQYFVKRFMLGEFIAKPENPEDKKDSRKKVQMEQWKGKIVEICDIEENFWSPRLGIKGKIDLTVKTENPGGEVCIQPLELKTGKATHSSSHQGQVMLYCMMSGDRREAARSGLLLYLRSSDMTQVPAGHHQQRGLVQLRNELVSWIHNPGDELPDPISHQSACQSCGLLDVCTSYQRVQDKCPPGPHPMAELVNQATSHLSSEHLEWFRKWTQLLDLEFHHAKGGAELKDLWCLTPSERETRGQAVSGLSLESVSSSLLEHRFVRDKSIDVRQGLAQGELVVVSTDKFLALSQGMIRMIDTNCVLVTFDKDLSKYVSQEGKTVFHLDRYIYQSAQSSCYVGLAKLLSNNPEAAKLRESCIDFTTPTFVPGLGREVAEHGKAVLKSLNKIQQRAVLRSIMCERYSLIRGMPGTGKTTTIVGLVRLLARMGKSVLIVAYTNSAVDTILTKLQQQDQPFLRLGRRERVKRELWSSCAETLAEQCSSVSGLGKLYNSYHVVASTCLAVNHPATCSRQFDYCICDEASQALLPAVISSLLLANRFILVGDHAQLPPTVQSSKARKGGLDQSLFSILDNQHPSATCSLTLQYRMNGNIGALANHLTYEGKLQCGDDCVKDRTLDIDVDDFNQEWIRRCFSSDRNKSVMFIDTNGRAPENRETGGVFNSKEAQFVKDLVSTLVNNKVSQQEIGVIAPYSAQVKFMKVRPTFNVQIFMIHIFIFMNIIRLSSSRPTLMLRWVQLTSTRAETSWSSSTPAPGAMEVSQRLDLATSSWTRGGSMWPSQEPRLS